jgi:plastocyanin
MKGLPMAQNQSRSFRISARAFLCFGMALLILSASPVPQGADAKARTRTVVLRGMDYLPATLVVNAGDTVIWKNEDIVPHTATDRRKNFDSGSIAPGDSWSYVANKKGTYFYYCSFHPNTKGKLVVR